MAITKAMTRRQSHICSNVSNVAQATALAAVSGPLDCVARMRATYDRRRRLAHERLSSIPGAECPMPEGAFYAFPSFQSVLGRELGGLRVRSGTDLCAALLSAARVTLVPGEDFGGPGCVRLSYALSDEDLSRGLDRIVEALAS